MTSIEDRLERLELDGDIGNACHILSGRRVEVSGSHATSEVRWAGALPRHCRNPQLTRTRRHIDELAREDGAVHQ
jgi:hypothetical protein